MFFYMVVFQHRHHILAVDQVYYVHMVEIRMVDSHLLYYTNHLLLCLDFSNITKLNVARICICNLTSMYDQQRTSS
uniref:Uncharacterized protein n=1 Tax=Schistosoma japonicum TaxID=6182 RepID=Q5C180_SCHJA|nr:unknown [Schistosoma japonicum]